MPRPVITPAQKDTSALGPENSFFQGHELPVKGSHELIARKKGLDGFYSAMLLIAFVIFIVARVFSPRKFSQFFAAFIKPQAMSQLLREEYAFTNRTTILLLSLYAVIIPLFGFKLCTYLTDGSFLSTFSTGQVLLVFLISVGFISGIYVGKIIVIRFLAFAFGLKSSGSEYIYTILLFNKIAGLIMAPIVLLLAFARQLNPAFLVYLGLLFLGILLVYRILRLIQIGLSSAGVSILYLFLYLCTLEILPFVVLIKLFMFSFS
jgi:hypothetical protein